MWFYPDINYTLTCIESEYAYNVSEENYLKDKTEDFYQSSKEKLKSDNDWGKPVDKTKCVSHKIVDQKVFDTEMYELSEKECGEILNDYTNTLNIANPEITPFRIKEALQVDEEGRCLYEIYGLHRNYDNKDNTLFITLWVIVNADGDFDKENGILVIRTDENEINEPSTLYSPQEIREFKIANNWAYGYCTE